MKGCARGPHPRWQARQEEAQSRLLCPLTQQLPWSIRSLTDFGGFTADDVFCFQTTSSATQRPQLVSSVSLMSVLLSQHPTPGLCLSGWLGWCRLIAGNTDSCAVGGLPALWTLSGGGSVLEVISKVLAQAPVLTSYLPCPPQAQGLHVQLVIS